MKPSKLALHSLLHALGVAVYSMLVASLMFNAESIFGKMNNFFGPATILMLFVLSAAIVGLLIFGRPVYMYLEGQKKDAVLFVMYTVCWLTIFTVAALSIIAATH